jgi:acetylornithine/succinyldiaminopimelate/putrescine aminotransferase
MSDEGFKNSFRPLQPGVRFIEFNSLNDLRHITNKTACVFAEYIQGEAGAVEGEKDFIIALKKKCNETGALLIADEVQTGFGRTGTLFAFEHYDSIPDILILAKGMGGGMPLGAFIASKEIMQTLSFHPSLGHITTFGGHPVSCAASLATLQVIQEMDLKKEVERKEKLFRSLLHHTLIKNISGKGLLLGVEFENAKINHEVIVKCLERGLLTDWFLFSPHKMRIAPPLIINDEMIKEACEIICESCHEVETTSKL